MMVQDTGEGLSEYAMPDDTGSVSRVTLEPVAEIHCIGNEVKVIAPAFPIYVTRHFLLA